MSDRSEALAARLEAGATKLAEFAATLSETEWQTPVPHDGRKIGVVVHHVASVYPIEINLAQSLAAGQPITAVTWDAVHAMNRTTRKRMTASPRKRHSPCWAPTVPGRPRQYALSAMRKLDRAAPVSLNGDAPLTCQFMLEDHAVRHSYHHLVRIRAALAR